MANIPAFQAGATSSILVTRTTTNKNNPAGVIFIGARDWTIANAPPAPHRAECEHSHDFVRLREPACRFKRFNSTKKNRPSRGRLFLVRATGLEPAQDCSHSHLKAACLPNSTTRAWFHNTYHITNLRGLKDKGFVVGPIQHIGEAV